MKIIYCIPSYYNSGGMERVLSVKANYIADVLGWDVVIVTTSQKGREPFYSFSSKIKTIDLGINYDDIEKMPLIKRIRARLKAKVIHKQRLRKVLLEEKADIVVSMFTHEMSFLPHIKDGSKKILELHFSKNFRQLDGKYNKKPTFIRLLNIILDSKDRKSIPLYDRFIVLSEKDAQAWGAKYKNLKVISNPTTFKKPSLTDITCNKVLAVGRLCPQKGFDTLISAWGIIPESLRHKWHLDIIGGGPDRNKLESQIKEAGLSDSINIHPPTDNIISQLTTHSIFCFPSRYEGFGLSLMEAMSTGMACVAFDCPCGPSEMITDNYNGFLISEQDDAHRFSIKLQSLMQSYDLRVKLGEKARTTISNKFSEEEIMKKWEEVFNELN